VVGTVRALAAVLSVAVLSATEGDSSPLAARILRATSPNESWAASFTLETAIAAANNTHVYKSLCRMPSSIGQPVLQRQLHEC
jgi:hypothetical protein